MHVINKYYRIIPNKRAGRGDEVGVRLLCALKCYSVFHGRIQPRRRY